MAVALRLTEVLCLTAFGGATASSRRALRAAPATQPVLATQSAPATQPAPQRAKLDVGFADFEKNLTSAIAAVIKSNLTGSSWNDDLRDSVIENVTMSLHKGLQDALKPVKMSIGKTWMALPQDDQKAAYVQQLRGSFESVMARAQDSLVTHLGIGIRHAAGLPKQRKQSTGNATQELLQDAEVALVSDLMVDHCYDDLKVKGKNGTAGKTMPKFCIPSAVASLAKRLNDTQGLVSMTMRFEARALDFAQQQKRGVVARRSA